MKRTILIINLCVFSLLAYSQKTIQEWGALDDAKFTKKLPFGTGIHYLKTDFKETGQRPKLENVGIFSYSLFSPNPDPRSDLVIAPMQITNSGSVFLVDELFTLVEPGITKGLNSQSLNYKTSDEYLDTEKKKELFQNANFEASKLAKASQKIYDFLDNRAVAGDVKVAPDGYKFLLQSSMDAKLWRAIGKFTGEVEIDGLINVEQTVYWDGKNLALGPIMMNLIIPNPFPESEDSWYSPAGPLKGYLEGVILAFVTIHPPKPYSLGELSKKRVELDFSGLDVIYAKIAKNLIDYYNDEFAKYEK